MQDSYIIRGGRVIDPSNGSDTVRDVYIENGRISSATAFHAGNPVEINATGFVVSPGFIDIHAHFREPGNENAETTATGSMSAARGGFTGIVTMPNTSPAIDNPQMISRMIQLGKKTGLVNIMPSGCITRDRRGASPADLPAMKKAGAAAFTDDGSTVADTALMRNAMITAAKLNIPIMDHALDPALAGNGVIREGKTQSALNLPGIPARAESIIVQRDIALSRETNCAVHIQHVSTAEAVDMIRSAKKLGLRITAEATPHHIALTDADITEDDANFKMNPPLGTEKDRQALISAVADGTIQAFATDHAPHTNASKKEGFRKAPFGIVGLETAVGITYSTMVESGNMTINDWIARWTTGPAGILGIEKPTLTENSPAHIVILDLKSTWTVNPDTFKSKSRNTPFKNRILTGQAFYTFCNGRMTHHTA